MDEPEEQNVPSEPIAPLWIGVGLVLALVAGWGTAVVVTFTDWGQRGQFGDMFGGINAVFSGLAFASLAYALHLQRRELSLQRLELALTRRELAKQAAAQTLQAATAVRAAQISGLGSLYEGYVAMWSAGRHGQIGDDPIGELRRVQKRLRELLDEQDSNGL